MNQAHVVVIDDDTGVLESLVSLLTIAGHRITAFTSAVTFLDRSAHDDVDCIITDIRLPQIDGLSLLQRLKERGVTAPPVIVISGHADVPVAVSAMQLGAMTVLEKPFPPARLVEAVGRAIEGRLIREGTSDAGRAVSSRFATLSAREREVLGHLLKGASSKVAARALGISHRTVDVFRASILRKMESRNLASLATAISGLR